MQKRTWAWVFWIGCCIVVCSSGLGESKLPQKEPIQTGWQLQDASKVPDAGPVIASPEYKAGGWYAATVPGTVLTSLVNNGVYPEPLYGENNRPDKIPDSLARTSYWYRTVFEVPKAFKHHHIWIHFEGINFASKIWVNQKEIGTTRGAFIRGIFDISSAVKPGKKAVLAVLVSPQPHPGVPHEHTILDGMGKNGGITALDGPTFLSTIGWDWMPAIRDRDTGIWQGVFLSASGPVLIKHPQVTTDLSLPSLDSAEIGIHADLENVSDKPQKGVFRGSFGEISFEQPVVLAPHSTKTVSLDSRTIAALHLDHPKLWWPNGYGPQNLYSLHLSFVIKKNVSDAEDVSFGVRKITYSVPDSPNLTISVNGVRIFVRGGDWGMDEAMKRIPRARLEAEIRMHQLAHLNMIRNWVGQSTSEDFYELCDQYGLLVWDEFFQPNPSDGPNPDDLDTYMANVRDKIYRFRNHPSIAVWCARNEGYPPKQIEDALQKLMAVLDPTRLYQSNSADGRGVHSAGPYSWRTPQEFYTFPQDEAFKTETGSVSIPTLESIHGMMPQKDWETINDDWAEHDLAKGAQKGDLYPQMLAERYGKIANLADFVRKGQLANYEAFRAMYEGRNAKMFHPSTGILTWMSNPAQPSFVWQLYHYDLEPNASLFAVKKAAEPVHIQYNESTGDIQVINNRSTALSGARAHLEIYNLDGSKIYEQDYSVAAAASSASDLGAVGWPSGLSAVHFIRLRLWDHSGQELSNNFYWRALPQDANHLQPLNGLHIVALDVQGTRIDDHGQTIISVTLHNNGTQVALMAHLQLRKADSGTRVLPVYDSDNYISLVPGESRNITMEVSTSELGNELPLVVVDGWNVDVKSNPSSQVRIALNKDAQVSQWPVTGLPVVSSAQ